MVFWVFSVCLHEFAHAAVAYLGGDTSVKDKGYLSMNPLHYMDPVYSVLMPILFLMVGGIGLPGGAVYINDSRLRSKYWSMAVSLAGPAANLMFAIVLGIVLNFDGVRQTPAAPLLAFLAWLQISAMLLNLLPIPPLDGYHAISPLLSYRTREQLDSFAQFGVMILFALLWISHDFNRLFFGTVDEVASLVGISSDLTAQGVRDFFFWKSN
jgi:Zn-dependent protease